MDLTDRYRRLAFLRMVDSDSIIEQYSDSKDIQLFCTLYFVRTQHTPT